MKRPSAELVALCGAVRDETATPEQIERLEELLVDDADARAFYLGFLQIDALVDRVEPVECASDGMPPPRWRLRPRAAIAWLALAASIVVLASVWFIGGLREPGSTGGRRMGDAVATVESSAAAAITTRSGELRQVRGGDALFPGEVVVTAAGSGAVIRPAGEDTLFILGPQTRLWFGADGSAKVVHLSAGRIFCDVAEQKKGSSWRIATADGETAILGTRLAVSATIDGTKVAVTSGHVRVTARETGRSVENPAGFKTHLTPTVATLTPLRLPDPQSVTSFTVVDADTNVTLSGFGALTDGATIDLAMLPSPRLSIRANCEPRVVGAVRFALSGVGPDGRSLVLKHTHYDARAFPNQIELFYPYFLAGDPFTEGAPQPPHPWVPAVGRYILTAVAYDGERGSGARGEPLTVRFEVVDRSVAGRLP
jgi:ferric-dicitrate binding protein FerR (iron transport regulator)